MATKETAPIDASFIATFIDGAVYASLAKQASHDFKLGQYLRPNRSLHPLLPIYPQHRHKTSAERRDIGDTPADGDNDQ
jgi:hypothetical protein